MGRQLTTANELERPAAVAELLALHATLHDQVVRLGSQDANTRFAFYYCARDVAALSPAERPPELDSVELLEAARRVAQQLQQASLAATASFLKGRALRDRGEIGAAITELREALRNTTNAPGILPQLQADLADLLRYRGEFDQALRLLDAAQQNLVEESDDERLARFHAALYCEIQGIRGQLLLNRGQPEQAAPLLLEALRRAEELDDWKAILGATIRQISFALAIEDTAEALRLVDSVLDREGQPPVSAKTRALLVARQGRALAERERDDPRVERTAAVVLEQSLDFAELYEPERLRVELTLAEVWLRDRRPDRAAVLLDSARLRLARQRNDRLPGQTLRLDARLASLAAEWALESAVPKSLLQTRLTELTDVYDRFLAEWRTAPQHPDGSGFLHYGTPRKLLSELIRVTLALIPGEAGSEQALDQLLKAQALGSVTRARGGTVPSLPTIRAALLHRGEGLLIYLPTPDRSHLFVHLEIAADVPIFAARRDFAAVVCRPPADRNEPSARERRRNELFDRGDRLAQLLLPDEARAIFADWTTITIVGADLIGTVPFEALPLDRRRRLGDDWALAYLPSVPLGLALGDQAARPTEGEPIICLLAGPTQSEEVHERWPDLAELKLSSEQLAALLAPYAPDRLRVLQSDQATAVNLDQAARSVGRVLQLWTHGIYDLSRPRPAGLVMAPDAIHADGLFWCRDAEQLHAPPLVVLSACGAARGPVRRGEVGVTHLGGAFLTAGAGCVVLPIADVEERATLELMSSFHWRLRRHGESPAEALRQARRQLASDPRFEDPFYHSLIQAVGAAHEPLFPGATPARGWGRWRGWIGGLAAALLLLLTATFVLLRRR